MTNTPVQMNQGLPSEAATRAHDGAHREVSSDAGVQSPSARKRSPIDSSYQDYLFGTAGSSAHPAWSDSTKGRFAIRLVSRGIVGAAFFAWGGRYAEKKLLNYRPETWSWENTNFLQTIAKGFDVSFGRAAQGIARLAAKSTGREAAAVESAVEQSTLFRTKNYFMQNDGLLTGGSPMNGRSYGAEAVGVTFDFAMASIGDATTRSAIQALDPNIRKPWMVDEYGETAEPGEKSHFSPTKFASAFAKGAWRIFSKNQGEDWFAAIPYVYQMKLQRQLLNNVFEKRFKGHKIQFDNGWNGGAYRVNSEGKIVGDLQLAGALDLHARFVGYNWYTLMYREGYDAIARGFKDWKSHGYAVHMPEHFNPITDTINGIGHSVRYVAKSFIKANLFMNPAVPFFWVFRVPQSKGRGGMIHVDAPAHENAIISNEPFSKQVQESLGKHAQTMGLNEAEMAERMVLDGRHNYAGARRMTMNGDGLHQNSKRQGNTVYMHDRPIENPMPAEGPYSKQAYEHYKTDTTFDKVEKGFSQALNPFGKLSYWAGTKMTRLVDKVVPVNSRFGKFLGADAQGNGSLALREKFVRGYVDAACSYTPYMWAKAETGLRVDDRAADGKPGQMDTAIYSWLDNLFTFNLRGAVADTKKIAHLATHFENRELKMREGGEEPPAPRVAARLQEQPSAQVMAEGRVRHDPTTLARVERPVDAANDARASNVRTGGWAKTVEPRPEEKERLIVNSRG